MELLTGKAPDGTDVSIPSDVEGDCPGKALGGYLCCVPVPGHVAHTGAAICAVWPV